MLNEQNNKVKSTSEAPENPIAELVPEQKDTEVKSGKDPQVINVDQDFAGDLDSAIAAAKDGDVVELGKGTYETEGIILDRQITIEGRTGSVIDGAGMWESIIELTPEASGTTIQNVEITNGGNGILGDGAEDLTLKNLNINNIGITHVDRQGASNIGIELSDADGLLLEDSDIHNIGRKGVGITDTVDAEISGLIVYDVNLEAEHAQSHDAAGIKFFNTHDVHLRDSYFININANNIWNDTANLTTIENNIVIDAGSDFRAPEYNPYVYMSGISNEKSSNAILIGNRVTAAEDFLAFKATEFSTETMSVLNNRFSSFELNTTDYWVNEAAEKEVALTPDPDLANFELFSEEYAAQVNLGE